MEDYKMHYEINVSRNRQGTSAPRHVFATHARSLTTEADAYDLAHLLEEVFPADLYEISISRIETHIFSIRR
jgi:hypothetical protein